MATPMTAAQVIAQLKKWNVSVKTPFPQWATHNRDAATGKSFGPVNGFVWHHTGADNTSVSYLYSGSTALPGPLCQFAIDPSGVVNMIGWGRCNHAGGGDPAVLDHVINEGYTGNLKPRYGEGDSGAFDGNDRLYGVEIVYSGNHGMTAAQYATALKLSAAICDFHNWGAKSVIGHYEWSRTKWDPGYAPGKSMDMSAVRDDIKRTLTGGTVVSTVNKPQAYKDVWETDAAKPPAGHATTGNPLWTPLSVLVGVYEKADQALTLLKKIADKLGVE